MRDLKGDWKDLFNGFMVALDMRKMFLAFCGRDGRPAGPRGNNNNNPIKKGS